MSLLLAAPWSARCAARPGPAVPAEAVVTVPAPITWSANRRLTWSDFLGPPDFGSDAAAITVYVLSFSSECTGAAFTFDVTSRFLPDRSWVKPQVILDARQSALSLQHERTHFDVSELSARRLRHALRAVPDACGRPASEVNAIVERIVAEDAEAQRRYDRATLFGSAAREQARWEEFVRDELSRSADGRTAPRRWPGA